MNYKSGLYRVKLMHNSVDLGVCKCNMNIIKFNERNVLVLYVSGDVQIF